MNPTVVPNRIPLSIMFVCRQKRHNEINPRVIPNRIPLSIMSASGGQILNQLRDYVQRKMLYKVARRVQSFLASRATGNGNPLSALRDRWWVLNKCVQVVATDFGLQGFD
jgi:hypothetical protein